jgi:hypothetical protein
MQNSRLTHIERIKQPIDLKAFLLQFLVYFLHFFTVTRISLYSMLSSKLNTPEHSDAQSLTSGYVAGISSTAANILIFLFAGTSSLFLALLWLPSTYVDNHYVPMGADSFYHARRILDLVNRGEFYQFDPKIHAPDGAFLTWPWLYDYLIAKLVIILQHLFNIADAMYIIVRIPPFWAYINALILLGITIQLRFSIPLRFLALICFAVSPLTQELHGAGRIDHHYMEFTMVLLTILAGLYWFRQNQSIDRSVMFGIVLGLSPSINNGLFILQLPVLITFFILWLKRQSLGNQSIAPLGLSLIITTLLILTPSEPFHAGLNSYYYLSWFHLYVACSSSLIVAFFVYAPFKTKTLGYFFIFCVALGIPIITQTISGTQFLIGDIKYLEEIPEMLNIFQLISASGFFNVMREYSGLLLASPIVIFVLISQYKNKLTNEYLFLLVISIFGISLLTMQQRLNYFGSYALYLPVLLLFELLLRDYPDKRKLLWLSLTSFLVVSYLPTLNQLTRSVPTARSWDYATTRQIYKSMANVCNKKPGVVLASHSDGHYIRFHTECSVIANPMLITPTDVQKVFLTRELMSMPADELISKYPWINYVYVRRDDNILANTPSSKAVEKNKGLRTQLLLGRKTFPKGYKLVDELRIELSSGQIVPFARLFQVKNSL